jgi:hypothetical protein
MGKNQRRTNTAMLHKVTYNGKGRSVDTDAVILQTDQFFLKSFKREMERRQWERIKKYREALEAAEEFKKEQENKEVEP